MNFLPFTAAVMSMFSSNIDYGYYLTDVNTAIIVSSEIPADIEEVHIPETLNGYTVTGIGGSAFSASVSVKKFVIPDTVLSIENGAFMGCTALQEVYIGNGVTRIPDDCFFACPELRTVRLPEITESIGSEAFFGCTELDLYVPAGVSYIGSNAFGKYSDPHLNTTVSVYGFLVRGVSGSYTEEYALQNGIDFIDMDNYTAGDVDNNNIVDATDASRILEEYALNSTLATSSFTRKQNITGDIDGNGIIDARDASGVLEIYAKLSTGQQVVEL